MKNIPAKKNKEKSKKKVRNKPAHTNAQKPQEETFDLDGFLPVASKQGKHRATQAGALTIVNTTKHGKRIAISSEVMERLGSPSEVQILMNHEGIAIGHSLQEDGPQFRIRTAGKKGVVYSSELVDELTETFKLSFDGISSLSFPKVRFASFQNGTLAFIQIR